MATAKQIEANRRNALRSTGPKTEEGKRRSRLNSLRHGLGAIHVGLPHEDPTEYADILAGLMQAWQPAGTQEQLLVHNIASAYLRMQRASRFEGSILNGQVFNLKGSHNKSLTPDADDDLGAVIAMANGDFSRAWELLDRYEKRAQAAYFRAIEALRKIQNDRKREPARELAVAPRKVRAGSKAVAPKLASFGAVAAQAIRPGPDGEFSLAPDRFAQPRIMRKSLDHLDEPA